MIQEPNTMQTSVSQDGAAQIHRWPRVFGPHVWVCFLVTLLITMLVSVLLPAHTMQMAVVQEFVLALLAFAFVWKTIGLGGFTVSKRYCEGNDAARSKDSKTSRSKNCGTDRVRALIVALVFVILLAAAIGGSTVFFVSVPSMEYVFVPLSVRIGFVIALCLFTGIFEECLFRGLGLVAFWGAFADRKNPFLTAAILQAAIFAFMHVSLQEACMTGSVIVWMQVLMKALQAFLFGLIMAALARCVQGLWLPIVVHTLFDCLYLGPSMIMSGVSNVQHFSGTMPDLAAMTVTALLLGWALFLCRKLFFD